MLNQFGKKHEIAYSLYKMQHELRDNFIEYIGKIGGSRRNIEWWVGRISGKNPWISKLFFNICLVKLATTIVKEVTDCDLCIMVVENAAVRRAILMNLSKLQFKTKLIVSRLECISLLIKLTARFIRIRLQLLRAEMYKMIYVKILWANVTKKTLKSWTETSKRVVLLQNWIDKRSFSGKQYTDNFFASLGAYLESRGEKVIRLVFTLRGFKSYPLFLEEMAKRTDCFIVPEGIVNMLDILLIWIRVAFKFPDFKTAKVAFCGLDVSNLVLFEKIIDWIDCEIYGPLLLNRMVFRMRHRGLRIDKFIYTFENQVWERGMLFGFKRWYPNIMTIAQQNAPSPKLSLRYFLSPKEIEHCPLPRVVFANGPQSFDSLKSIYGRKTTFLLGGCIRHIYLLKREDAKVKVKNKSDKTITVLVTTSIGLEEASELTYKIIQFLKDNRRYKVIFKFHPFMPFDIIRKRLNLREMPNNFIISEHSVADLIQSCDVLVYNTSTSAIEALAHGIPVINVVSEFALNIDPLDFASDVVKRVYSGVELLSALELAKKNKNNSQEIEKRRKVAQRYFGNMDEEDIYKLFINMH